MTIRLATATGIAVLALAFQCTIAFAQSDTSASKHFVSQHLQTDYNLPPNFDSDQLASGIATATNHEYESKYGLKPGFHEAEYCRAAGDHRISEIKSELNLPTGFSDVDFNRLAGAKVVNRLIERFHLPPNFSEQQLQQAHGLDRSNTSGFYDTGWSTPHAPFSAAEFMVAAGRFKTHEIAVRYDLDQNWTYSDLALSAGPQQAMTELKRFGFSKTSNHAEIVNAIGNASLAEFSGWQHLPADFTPEQLITVLGKEEIQRYRERYEDQTGSVDEAWLSSHEAAFRMRQLRYSYPALPNKFSETDLIAAIGNSECGMLRDAYGLDPNFSESDLSAAVSASRMAEIRHDYKLQRQFNAGDIDKAEEKKGSPLFY